MRVNKKTKNKKDTIQPITFIVILLVAIFIAGSFIEGQRTDCSDAGIVVANVRYCDGWLTGRIMNSGSIKLENIRMHVVFELVPGAQIVFLTQDGYAGVEETTMFLKPDEHVDFTIWLDHENYELIEFHTPTCSGMQKSVTATEVTRAC
jgi:hypothetical protein